MLEVVPSCSQKLCREPAFPSVREKLREAGGHRAGTSQQPAGSQSRREGQSLRAGEGGLQILPVGSQVSLQTSTTPPLGGTYLGGRQGGHAWARSWVLVLQMPGVSVCGLLQIRAEGGAGWPWPRPGSAPVKPALLGSQSPAGPHETTVGLLALIPRVPGASEALSAPRFPGGASGEAGDPLRAGLAREQEESAGPGPSRPVGPGPGLQGPRQDGWTAPHSGAGASLCKHGASRRPRPRWRPRGWASTWGADM